MQSYCGDTNNCAVEEFKNWRKIISSWLLNWGTKFIPWLILFHCGSLGRLWPHMCDVITFSLCNCMGHYLLICDSTDKNIYLLLFIKWDNGRWFIEQLWTQACDKTFCSWIALANNSWSVTTMSSSLLSLLMLLFHRPNELSDAKVMTQPLLV